MTQKEKIQAKFFPFTQETYIKLKEANLTAGEWRLWGFLVTSIPFGDKYEELPETLSILSECLISKSVFYRAIAKLQDFGLFDFQDRGFYARNLSYPKVELVEKSSNSSFSQNWESSPRIGKAVPELGKQSQNWENRSPEPLQDKDGDRSQTIKNIKISHIPEGERDQKNENEENQSNQEEKGFQELDKPNLQENQEIKVKKIDSKVGVKGEFSPAAAIAKKRNQFENSETFGERSVELQRFDWLPPGPWAIDGKLDPHFRDAIAQDWVNRYGGDLHQRRADVLINFKKDPANLAIRWEQYSSEWHKRYENTHLHLANGVSIKPDYQKRLIENHRAITQPLPPELNPIAIPPVVEAGFILPSVETKAIAPTRATSSPKPDNGENAQAYEYWDAEPEADSETTQKYKDLISDFLGKFGGGSKAEPEPKPPTELERLNSWINDPILRPEVLKKVMASDRYSALFDEEGTPYQIIEVKADG